MRSWWLLLLLIPMVLVAACGGGGGGGGGGPANVLVTGRVIDLRTFGPPTPAASVQIGSVAALTDANGVFQLSVPAGATSVVIDSRGASGVWTYSFAAATQPTNDVGDLYVAPQKTTVTGRALSAADESPVVGAQVEFGGRRATTSASGAFTLADVAYVAADFAGFWQIEGAVRSTGFFTGLFRAEPSIANGENVVVLDDILLIPVSDTTPPDTPYNVWGRVSPGASAPGTQVTVKQGGTSIRRFTVGANGLYWFWLAPGAYTLSYTNGSLTAADQSVNLERSDQVVRRDVTLN